MSPKSKIPTTPKHLGKRGRSWWEYMAKEHAMVPSEFETLTLAAECLDRCDEARRTLDNEGMTVSTEAGSLKSHPALAVEARMKLVFVRLLASLKIKPDQADETDITQLEES